MALNIKQKFIVEELIDAETGKKLGVLKFNPNDARIMGKLSKIVQYLTEDMDKIKELGDFSNLSDKDFNSLEDFEKESENINKICKGLDLESSAIKKVIDDLSEVFGEETINIFTGGTNDIDALMPLLDFVMPYVQKTRNDKVGKYLKKNNTAETFILE